MRPAPSLRATHRWQSRCPPAYTWVSYPPQPPVACAAVPRAYCPPLEYPIAKGGGYLSAKQGSKGEEVDLQNKRASAAAIALFVLGWLCPLCWLAGSFYLCGSRGADKKARGVCAPAEPCAPSQQQQPYGSMPPPPPTYNAAAPYTAAYPPPPAAIVAQPVATYEATPFVEHQVVRAEDEGADALVIVLFVLGWFIGLCWIIGSFFMCSHKKSNRKWGIACAVCFCISLVVAIIYVAAVRNSSPQ
eukprot:m51a1_g8049 hypothetical protein (245) ;mRNA; r:97559-99360